MPWHHEPELTKILPPEVLLTKEVLWVSSYNEPDRWVKDLKEAHYSLIGEYEVDLNHKLLRFEFDESLRKEIPNAPHFQSVLINNTLPPVKLGNFFEATK